MTPPAPQPDRIAERRLMVDGQIRTFGVTDLAVIERFLAVPREDFVDAAQAGLAYSDAILRLPGAPARSLLAPMVLARMIQHANVRPGDRVLDVAGGLGYSAALLSGLAGQVAARESGAARCAAMRTALAPFANVRVAEEPLTGGSDRYDVILLNGSYAAGIEPLLAQLAEGGRLLAVRSATGGSLGQAVRFEKTGASAGLRPLFDARAPVLEGFAAAAAFAF